VIRVRNWLRNYPSKWKLDVRYEGKFSFDVLDRVQSVVLEMGKNGLSVKIMHKSTNTIQFTISDTMSFVLDVEIPLSGSIIIKLIISMAPFEIGCNDAKRKLNEEIIPVLTRLEKTIAPDNTAYVMSIDFINRNPFQSLFASRLNPDQIASYNVTFLWGQYSKEARQDFVEVNKKGVVLNTGELHSLNEMANDFLYLSASLKQFMKG
jgi:hypothetical protein